MPRRQSDRAKKALKRHAASVRSRQEVGRSDRRSWPVVRAYVPVEDCFRATGCGTAGVLRRAPDGSLTSAFFTIELIRGGLMDAFGKSGTDYAETETLLSTMGASIPSLEPGSVDLAARYIWGAYAWSLERGRQWPATMRSRYLDVAPLLDGTRDSWLEQFAGPNGLLPSKLVEIARRNTTALDDIPDGREVVVFTTITLALDDAEDAVRRLRKSLPDFAEEDSEDDAVRFAWTREYPKGHWSPLSRSGGRQSLGSVEISKAGAMTAQAKTLSMAAVLVGKLRHELGPRIRVVKTEWKDAADLTGR